MAKETTPVTYRVSPEVDAELKRLARVHGGVDRALQILMFEERGAPLNESRRGDGEDALPEILELVSHLQEQIAELREGLITAPLVAPEIVPMKGFVPAAESSTATSGLNACRHCGEDGKISPRTNPWRACGDCAGRGHMNMAECRKCRERDHQQAMESKSSSSDPSTIDFNPYEPA